MSHSFYKIWLHLIFSTMDRKPMIADHAEKDIFKYIAAELSEVGCIVKIINGMPDHVHCLFQQNPNKSVAEIVKHLKGVSSHWINQNNIIPLKFSWQTGYGVFSVSESQLEKVFQYISNQKKHHLKRTFDQEFDEILNNHNMQGQQNK